MSGYERTATKDEFFEDVEKTITKFKWVVMVINVLTFFIGMATFSLCMWIRFDLDFWEWVIEIDWYSYWYATYLIMIAMVGVVINSVLGVWSVVQENTGLMLANSIILGILMIFEFSGAITICIYGVEESKILIRELNEVFIDLVYKWDQDPRASRILRQIFEYVGCCGADGSDDFIKAKKPVPFECRDLVTGNEYAYGCRQALAWWLEPWTATLAGICTFLIVAGVVGIIFNRKLRSALRQY